MNVMGIQLDREHIQQSNYRDEMAQEIDLFMDRIKKNRL